MDDCLIVLGVQNIYLYTINKKDAIIFRTSTGSPSFNKIPPKLICVNSDNNNQERLFCLYFDNKIRYYKIFTSLRKLVIEPLADIELKYNILHLLSFTEKIYLALIEEDKIVVMMVNMLNMKTHFFKPCFLAETLNSKVLMIFNSVYTDYRNCFINYRKTEFNNYAIIMTSKGLYYVKVMTWSSYVKKIQSRGKTTNALKLIKNLITKKINCFPGLENNDPKITDKVV